MVDQNDAQLEQGVMPENHQVDNQNDMASLLDQEGPGIEFPKAGEIRNGVIASITPGQILVSVGTKSEGMITGKEYELIPSEELSELKVGQEIPVFVVNPEDQNGNLVLSYVRAREEVSWTRTEELLNSKEVYHSSIVGYNKGGLIVPVGGLRGFVPSSQISLSRRAGLSGETPDQRWSKMIGQEIDVIVIEVDRERRRLILSERAASTETRETLKERVIDELKEGEIRTGRVTSLADFGAFVNINGADGLVHLSEISWDRIQHPGEVLKVGQEDDLEGLIHISEISEKRIEHPKEVLHEGEQVTLRIIKIDPENHRIGLSLRRVESMAYADMDWQSLDEILGNEEEKPADETDAEEPAA